MALTRRSQAARERALREREERIQKAPGRLPELERIKKQHGKPASEARASSTDAEATVMKMAVGGFRPAYNAQYATDSECQVIFGVDVVSSGSDMAQMAPMVEQVSERCVESSLLMTLPAADTVDGNAGYKAPERQAIDIFCGWAPAPGLPDQDAGTQRCEEA